MPTIIQCVTAPAIPAHETVRPYMSAWCNESQWEYLWDHETKTDRHFYWEKYRRIIDFCESRPIGSIGVAIDVDALPIKGARLDKAIDGYDLGYTRFREGGFCDGVTYFRVSDWTRQFFKRVWDHGEPDIRSALWGASTEYVVNKLLCGDESAPVKVLDSSWNFYPRSPRAYYPIQVHAWHGVPWREKGIRIQNHLEFIEWPRPV